MKIVQSLIRITLMVNLGILLAFILAPEPKKSTELHHSATFTVKDYAPYTRPLKTAEGDSYCSSSSINYKGSVFTLTNNHCCEAVELDFGIDERRVGNSIETIVHQAKNADICVLTSSQKDTPITIASEEFEYLDVTIVMGYPQGLFLTVTNGRLGQFNSNICFHDFSKDPPKECFISNKISNSVFPGNSGSPVFNSNGEVTNLVYASHMFPTFIGISVPHRFIIEALEESIVKK